MKLFSPFVLGCASATALVSLSCLGSPPAAIPYSILHSPQAGDIEIQEISTSQSHPQSLDTYPGAAAKPLMHFTNIPAHMLRTESFTAKSLFLIDQNSNVWLASRDNISKQLSTYQFSFGSAKAVDLVQLNRRVVLILADNGAVEWMSDDGNHGSVFHSSDWQKTSIVSAPSRIVVINSTVFAVVTSRDVAFFRVSYPNSGPVAYFQKSLNFQNSIILQAAGGGNCLWLETFGHRQAIVQLDLEKQLRYEKSSLVSISAGFVSVDQTTQELYFRDGQDLMSFSPAAMKTVGQDFYKKLVAPSATMMPPPLDDADVRDLNQASQRLTTALSQIQFRSSSAQSASQPSGGSSSVQTQPNSQPQSTTSQTPASSISPAPAPQASTSQLAPASPQPEDPVEVLCRRFKKQLAIIGTSASANQILGADELARLINQTTSIRYELGDLSDDDLSKWGLKKKGMDFFEGKAGIQLKFRDLAVAIANHQSCAASVLTPNSKQNNP